MTIDGEAYRTAVLRENEALRESMQRWIDHHSARADKAEALVGEK